MSDLTEKALRLLFDAESMEDEGDEFRAIEGSQAVSLLALAEAVEQLVAVVRDSVRVPVVFNITNEKLSHEQGSAIAEKLRRLLNPATVRDVDLTPEAVPHD